LAALPGWEQREDARRGDRCLPFPSEQWRAVNVEQTAVQRRSPDS
ncbi:unnamed protein product, partial [Gulo gulo]